MFSRYVAKWVMFYAMFHDYYILSLLEYTLASPEPKHVNKSPGDDEESASWQRETTKNSLKNGAKDDSFHPIQPLTKLKGDDPPSRVSLRMLPLQKNNPDCNPIASL